MLKDDSSGAKGYERNSHRKKEEMKSYFEVSDDETSQMHRNNTKKALSKIKHHTKRWLRETFSMYKLDEEEKESYKLRKGLFKVEAFEGHISPKRFVNGRRVD
jgi:hypothetical protein